MSKRLLIVGFVCCALCLLLPPLGLVALVIGVVALIRGQRRAGVVLVVLGVLLPFAGNVILQSFFVKPYRIPSETMAPAIAVGDRVLVWRAYGAPHVGDIVVHHPPAGAQAGDECGVKPVPGQACPRPTPQRSDVNFVKRIVAGPGDTLAIVGGHVLLDGKRQPEPFASPCSDGESCDFPKPITIPPDHWFMMGDNRGASDDSRFWGPVPGDWIVGRVFLRYWPADRAGGL